MLPTNPVVGGKGSGLKLKTDMSGVGGSKKGGKAKIAGSMKKNPGTKGSRKRA